MEIMNLDLAEEVEIHGNKAVNLSGMINAGFPVPSGFVLPVHWFHAYNENGKNWNNEWSEVIESNLIELKASKVMVRSSAVGEDSENSSFAGQLSSFQCDSRVESVIQGVIDCWNSYYNLNIHSYETSSGTTLKGMGVIVQELVDPDHAGVLFTRSPLQPDKMFLEYIDEHGENLVSGNKTPISLELGGKNFSEVIKVGEAPDIKLLNEKLLYNIIDHAQKLKTFFGFDLDIEWVIRNEKIYIVQSRPLTVENNVKSYWSNTNINENYPFPVSPLLYSIARDSYYHYFKNLAALFQIGSDSIQKLEKAFSNVIGIFGCRLYYNMSSIHEILSASPFSKLLISSFDNFVGFTDTFSKKEVNNTFWKKLRFIREFLAFNFTIKKHVKEFERITSEYSEGVNSGSLNLEKSFHGFIEIRMHSWFHASLADFFAMVYHGLLGKLCKCHYGPEGNAVHNKLIQAIPNIISIKPVMEMHSILKEVNSETEVKKKFYSMDGNQFYRWTRGAEGKKYKSSQRIEDYLQNWGFRCSGELMFTTSNYAEDPEKFIDLLKQYDSVNRENPNNLIEKKSVERKRFMSSFRRKIAKKYHVLFPLTVFHIWLLNKVTKLTANAISYRERVRLKQALVYFRFRQTIFKIGESFNKKGLLENSKDIIFLNYKEIGEHLSASAMLYNKLSETVEQRKVDFKLQSELLYPDNFSTDEGKYTTPENVEIMNKVEEEEGVLRGLSACGGVLNGKVKVLDSIDQADKLKKGDILVTQQTDPGWVVVFPLISGLIVERGGILSHGAIVSREFGIPAIVGVRDVTKILKDNEEITLDANRGIIIRND